MICQCEVVNSFKSASGWNIWMRFKKLKISLLHER